jgi:hypothetical protein
MASRHLNRVTVIANPAPREPHVLAMVIAGIRRFEIHGASSRGPVSARWHQRDGAWFDLARNVSFDGALKAINEFIDLTWDLAPGWSAERDQFDVAAAAAVLAGPAADLALAA